MGWNELQKRIAKRLEHLISTSGDTLLNTQIENEVKSAFHDIYGDAWENYNMCTRSYNDMVITLRNKFKGK